MKSFLKVTTVAVLAASLLGCGYEKEAMTPDERLFMKTVFIGGNCSGGSFYESIAAARGITESSSYSAAIDAAEKAGENHKPFCDVPAQFRSLSNIYYDKYSCMKDRDYQYTLYEELYGETYHEACGLSGKTSSDTPKKSQKPQESLISLELYDQVILAARTCERARQELMMITSKNPGNPVITVEEYNRISEIALKCKAYEMEKAVNER